MDLTGILLLGLNHKTIFLDGMNANPHWLNKTDSFLPEGIPGTFPHTESGP